MRVLGIDPGSIRAGYAILDSDGLRIRIVSSGSICLEEHAPMAIRLKQLGEDLEALIRRYQPTELALESIFFSKNAKSSLVLGQSRGVCLFMAGRNDLSVFEYSPTQVKSAIGGGGRARKDQVQHMLRLLLRLPADYSFVSHDHSDALAIAITHVHAKQNLSTQFKHGRLSKSDRISSRKDSLSQPE